MLSKKEVIKIANDAKKCFKLNCSIRFLNFEDFKKIAKKNGNTV